MVGICLKSLESKCNCLPVHDSLWVFFPGEVSDSETNGSCSSSDSETSSEDEFTDGYGEDFMGDEEDRARLEQMTEKEREQELFNRIEKREVLKKR